MNLQFLQKQELNDYKLNRKIIRHGVTSLHSAKWDMREERESISSSSKFVICFLTLYT
jgi:hypothetical protein